ncbi:hypothetical protein KZZ52_20760 [Dactylosporangium sp. AC04546]|uniref:hypothetical protein n=1 Tax=Dactylosporangium sp. AC04546 TaxID=2862460 RepID=UPI001EDD3241|nr:hypothetical protein [Dactylosporangium sp. AC04546]WVK87722.1 hypothetical protein KZZ52_20760 [Dactylosporangium sp. AC04546]
MAHKQWVLVMAVATAGAVMLAGPTAASAGPPRDPAKKSRVTKAKKLPARKTAKAPAAAAVRWATGQAVQHDVSWTRLD